MSTISHEKDVVKAKVNELKNTHHHNWKKLDDRDKELDELQLKEENTQLKAHLKHLNPQEL